MTDPYSILGVAKSASADEIRKAYRKLAKSLHPDTRPDDKASEERFKQVTAAFKLLSDPEKRAKFDRGEIDAEGRARPQFHFRSRPGPGAGPGDRAAHGRFEDLGDIFSDLFAEAGRNQRRRPAPMRGADIRQRAEVSFAEMAKGAKRRVSLPDGRTVEAAIPAGVEDGQVLRLKGQGMPGQRGGPDGSLLLEVGVKPHAFFRREGRDIRLDLPITLKEALFGGKVRAPTVDGMVEVNVPAGANSGAQLRLRGKGVADRDGKRGDQIIRLMIDVPLDDPALEKLVEDWTPPASYDPRKRYTV
jgi:DnaJ-class molecular chaperone